MSKTVSLIMTHPDDAEILCMGTILKFLDKGYNINVNIVCSGNMGISVQERDSIGVSGIDEDVRSSETLNAFNQYEKIKLNFLGFKDGKIKQDIELTSAIERVLIHDKPDIVITHFNDLSGNDHQEHAIVSKSTTNAINRLKKIEMVLYAQPIFSHKTSFSPNFFVDITHYFNDKIKALSFHKSQAGRFYLSKKFHLMRCEMNALNSAVENYTDGKLFESYISEIVF